MFLWVFLELRRASAASAAFLLASSCAFDPPPLEPEPTVRGGPPTVRGTLDFGAAGGGLGFGGAEESVRPGWSKGEGSELLKQLPILGTGRVRLSERRGGRVWVIVGPGGLRLP